MACKPEGWELRGYLVGRHAAQRMVRLVEELPGTVRGIDYERLHVATETRSKHGVEAWADVRLDRLDEFRDLERVFLAVAAEVGEQSFRTWWAVRIEGKTYEEQNQYSTRHAKRIVRKVDEAVADALIERDLLEGYAGRDMLEAGGKRAKGVTVWFNPEAWKE